MNRTSPCTSPRDARLVSPINWHLAVALLAISAPYPAVAQGRWTYGSTKDEMTDVLRVNISANSIPTRSGRGYRISGTLAWRCSADDGRDVLLLLGTYFGGNSDDQVLVEYRFDSEPASEGVWWNQSTSHRGAFMPDADIPEFTEHVKRSDRLIIRVTDPLDSETVTYTFNLQGFTAAYRRFDTNCAATDSSRTRSEGEAPKGSMSGSDQVYSVDVVQEKPERFSGPQAQYPPLLQQAGIEGRVIVQAIIDTSGRVEPNSVRVVESANPGFDVPAKNAVLKSLFRPGRVYGRAVRVLVNLPIDFKITGRH